MIRNRFAVEVASPRLPRVPKVSVAMPTYNHRRFIAEAIDGVLMQQTDFEWELVIGDDDSTDGTREIVLEYQRAHPDRIRVLIQPKNTRGIGNCDEVDQACRGEYVAQLEGDDFWTDPQKLQLQANLLDAHPDAFLCGARALVWEDGAAAPAEVTPGDPSATLATFSVRELFEGRWWFRTCTKMFRRTLLQSVPLRYQGDWSGTMWLIASTNFAPVVFLDQVVGVYRKHAGGIFSGIDLPARLAQDVRTLFDLIPVFAGADREFLQAYLNKTVAEILAFEAVPASRKIGCACLATWRSPLAKPAWKNLASSLVPGRAFPRR